MSRRRSRSRSRGRGRSRSSSKSVRFARQSRRAEQLSQIPIIISKPVELVRAIKYPQTWGVKIRLTHANGGLRIDKTDVGDGHDKRVAYFTAYSIAGAFPGSVVNFASIFSSIRIHSFKFYCPPLFDSQSNADHSILNCPSGLSSAQVFRGFFGQDSSSNDSTVMQRVEVPRGKLCMVKYAWDAKDQQYDHAFFYPGDSTPVSNNKILAEFFSFEELNVDGDGGQHWQSYSICDVIATLCGYIVPDGRPPTVPGYIGNEPVGEKSAVSPPKPLKPILMKSPGKVLPT